MSTSGGAPFFGTPGSEPERDGTLDGGATGERFADPLAGLVTAAEAVPAARETALPTARPVQHDPEAVKRMVEAALQEDVAAPPKVVAPVSGEREDNVPLGLLPRQRTWPTRAPQLLKKVPRPRVPRPKASAQIADDEIEAELTERQPKGRRLPTIGMPNLGRPSNSTAGVLLAIALLIVFALVAVFMLSSLVSSVTGLFS